MSFYFITIIIKVYKGGIEVSKLNEKQKAFADYYIENKTYTEVMPIINIYNRYHFFELCKKVLNEFLELI